jgi:hypothetical protein
LTTASAPSWAERARTALELAHASDLLACVLAHGHDAVAVVPRALDRYGIVLAAIFPDGVHQLRLNFPGGPVDALDGITTGFRLPLRCRCRAEDRSS